VERPVLAAAAQVRGEHHGHQLALLRQVVSHGRVGAQADRERAVILAEAERDAQKLRGEGDAQATRLYAQAANKDPSFYAFQRSLEAYRTSFSDGQSVIVLDRDDPFLQYMKSDR